MYSTSADVREHPLSVADRRGQVAHTRGSGEAVASTRSEEQRMAIIFLLPWLEELEKCDSCTEKCCLPIAQLTEILGCGGTMLRLVKSSAYIMYALQVHILVCTRNGIF